MQTMKRESKFPLKVMTPWPSDQ